MKRGSEVLFFWRGGPRVTPDMERFIAILLEHTGGNFPLWLMPEQVSILTLSEKYEKYAEKVLNVLENNEIRALVDNRSETIGKKIREAELNKIPYMLILGDQEEVENSVSVRKHSEGDLGSMTAEAFSSLLNDGGFADVKVTYKTASNMVIQAKV